MPTRKIFFRGFCPLDWLVSFCIYGGTKQSVALKQLFVTPGTLVGRPICRYPSQPAEPPRFLLGIGLFLDILHLCDWTWKLILILTKMKANLEQAILVETRRPWWSLPEIVCHWEGPDFSFFDSLGIFTLHPLCVICRHAAGVIGLWRPSPDCFGQGHNTFYRKRGVEGSNFQVVWPKSKNVTQQKTRERAAESSGAIARKADCHVQNKFQRVLDFRPLINATIKDGHPFPRIVGMLHTWS